MFFNNTGTMKGNQTVLVSDTHRIRSSEYRHRHRLHVKHPGFNLWGNIEVKEIMEVMKLMVEGEDGYERKTFHENPHSTWENYFSGDQIMNWLGGNGFGSTMTCRRDWFPADIEGK